MSQRKEELFELAFHSLANSHCAVAFRLVTSTCSEEGMLDYWRSWKHSFFLTILPVQSVLKIVDIWMSEGHKALFRVALVLLKAYEDELSNCSTRDDISCLLSQANPLASRVPINMQVLLDSAFKLYLARKHIEKLDKVNADLATQHVKLRPSLIAFHKPHWPSQPLFCCQPCGSSNLSSRILDQARLEKLWEMLPPTLASATPQLLYNSMVHGYPLTRLFAQLERINGSSAGFKHIPYAGSFIVLKTVTNCIIGAFCDRPMVPRSSNAVHYCGSKGCFVFAFQHMQDVADDQLSDSLVDVYRWSGLNECFFQVVRESGTSEQLSCSSEISSESIRLGGGCGQKVKNTRSGYALYIESNGQRAHSASCETFASPALVDTVVGDQKKTLPRIDNSTFSSTGGFEIESIEVIVLTDVPCAL